MSEKLLPKTLRNRLVVSEPMLQVMRTRCPVAERLGAFDRFLQRRWQIPLPKGPFHTLLPPSFIDQDARARLEEVTYRMIENIYDFACERLSNPNHTHGGAFAKEPHLVELMRNERQKALKQFLIARPDIVFDRDDQPRLLEINLQTGIGGLFELEQQMGFYLDVPEFREAVLERTNAPTTPIRLFASYLDELRVNRLAVLDLCDNICFSAHLVEYLNRYSNQIHAHHVYIPELTFNALEKAFSVDGKVMTDVLINLAPAYFKHEFLRGFWQNVSHGEVCNISPLLTHLVSDKCLLADYYQMAVLSSDAMTVSTSELIAPCFRMIPGDAMWQGSRIDRVDFALNNRADLVLKAGEGQGAEGVFIGKYMAVDEWHSLIRRILEEGSQDYCVQAFIESQPVENWHWDDGRWANRPGPAVVSPFIFGSRCHWGVRIGAADSQRPIVSPLDNNCSVVAIV